LSICPDKITVKGESNIVLQQANVLEQARIGVNLLDQTRGVIGNLDSGFRINIAQDERTGNTREFVVSGLTWTCDVDGLCMIEGTISKIIDNKY